MAPEREHGEPPEADLRASIVPRWLAWIVLLALLGAAALSAWQCATGATLRPPPRAEPAGSGSPQR